MVAGIRKSGPLSPDHYGDPSWNPFLKQRRGFFFPVGIPVEQTNNNGAMAALAHTFPKFNTSCGDLPEVLFLK